MNRRDRTEARAWMVMNKIKPVDIQQALELKYLTQVSETLLGKRNDRRVLQFLLDSGCPEHYLDLPQKMRRAA
ncbi:hypothetical protein [Desulfofustis limnaeus]|uniref:Uncharacterized protein n=1 Tax=Desulfofustis limnaeus TaxID=2740163 RepID=A0ABN6LZ86_9BACT|nr:hypothetical protein [Desulfofustis limnaeus]BDD85968.1 hypothetical protein DPPLL_03330 [Desulfofustis limnaeus]